MLPFLIATGVLAGSAATGATDTSAPIRAELLASTMRPRPGSTVLLGIRMIPQPRWHGYWSNPGENGLAPSVQWTAPAGVRFGPLLHPAPTLLQSVGMASYVHVGPHVLLSRMTIGRSVATGSAIPVAADLRWAACSATQCVPQHALLSLQMVAGDGRASADAGVLSHAAASLPAHAPSGTFSVTGGKLALHLPENLRVDAHALRFFPETSGYFDALAARTVTRAPASIETRVKGPVPDTVAGIVTDGASAYRLTFHRSAPEAAPSPAAPRLPHENSASTVPASDVVSKGSPTAVALADDQPLARLSRDTILRALVLVGLLGFSLFVFAVARRPNR